MWSQTSAPDRSSHLGTTCLHKFTHKCVRFILNVSFCLRDNFRFVVWRTFLWKHIFAHNFFYFAIMTFFSQFSVYISQFGLFLIYIYIYAFSRRFYPKRLTVHSGYTFFFYQYVCSLGIEPTTFCAANTMLYH